MLTSNLKLKKSGIWGFGLAPGLTCNETCNVDCFGCKGAYAAYSRTCSMHWDSNLEHSQDEWFIGNMIAEILRSGATTIRIHPEGDFYSQQYLDSWFSVARCLPGVEFYCYTKEFARKDWSKKPDNIKMIQS